MVHPEKQNRESNRSYRIHLMKTFKEVLESLDSYVWRGGAPWDDDRFEENAKNLGLEIKEDDKLDRDYVVLKRPVVLYHATLTTNVKSILATGIRKSSSKGNISGVYMSSKQGIEDWRGKGKTTTLAVRVPKGTRLYQDVQPNAVVVTKNVPKKWILPIE